MGPIEKNVKRKFKHYLILGRNTCTIDRVKGQSERLIRNVSINHEQKLDTQGKTKC